MIDDVSPPAAPVLDATTDRLKRSCFCEETCAVVEHVECCACRAGFDGPSAVKLALDNGYVRDGTAWVCFECFKVRR